MKLRMLIAAAMIGAAPVAGAQEAADPVVKVINFTADWCPNCRIVDPRINEAIARFPEGEIELVRLDLTQMRRTDEETTNRAMIDAIRLADSHQAGYLWDWYGRNTGISVIISADNGEPLSCVMAMMDVDEIEYRLTEARILTLRAPAGARKPRGPDCPPPL